jgi:hypothetical protein
LPELGQFDAPEPLVADPTRPGAFGAYAYGLNNPVVFADPDGRCGIVGAGVGAVAGAVIGGGIELVRQAFSDDEDFDFTRVSQVAFGATLAGTLAGATCGASLLFQASAGGVTAATGGAATRALAGDEQTAGAVATDVVIGAVTGGLVAGGSQVVRAVRQDIDDIVAGAARGLQDYADEAARAAAPSVRSASAAAPSSVTQSAGASVAQTVASPSAVAASRGGGALFRGTTEGYPGSPALQRIGITPTTTDPVVGTLFGIEASNSGRGVLLLAPRSGVPTGPGNVLATLEAEVGVELAPAVFAQRAQSIPLSAAQDALRRMGINLPSRIADKAALDQALRNSPRLSAAQIEQFLRLVGQ